MATVWDEALCEEPRTPHDFHPVRHRRTARRETVTIDRLMTGLTAFTSALKKQARLAAAVGKAPQLKAIARELFLGKVQILIEDDPEITDKHYVVVDVEATGDLKEIASRRREWYNLTGVFLGPEAELVQLVVTVVE